MAVLPNLDQFSRIFGMMRVDGTADAFPSFRAAKVDFRTHPDAVLINQIKGQMGTNLITLPDVAGVPFPALIFGEWDNLPQTVLWYHRFHQTRVHWSLTLTYMDLLLQAYAIVGYLQHCCSIRETPGPFTAEAIARADWNRTRATFIRDMAAHLAYLMLHGPDTPSATLNITNLRQLDRANDPSFPFFVFPILQMFKNRFPVDFDFHQTMDVRLSLITAKNKRKFNNYGCYSNYTIYRTNRNPRYAVEAWWLQGFYYPFYRVLSMVSARNNPMDGNRRKLGKRNGRFTNKRGYCCSNNQLTFLRARSPLRWDVTIPGHPPMRMTITTMVNINANEYEPPPLPVVVVAAAAAVFNNNDGNGGGPRVDPGTGLDPNQAQQVTQND